jgi:hypothetical protein
VTGRKSQNRIRVLKTCFASLDRIRPQEAITIIKRNEEREGLVVTKEKEENVVTKEKEGNVVTRERKANGAAKVRKANADTKVIRERLGLQELLGQKVIRARQELLVLQVLQVRQVLVGEPQARQERPEKPELQVLLVRRA